MFKESLNARCELRSVSYQKLYNSSTNIQNKCNLKSASFILYAKICSEWHKENSNSVRDRRWESSGDYNALTKLGFAWKFWCDACDATRNATGFIIWRPWKSTSNLIWKKNLHFEHIDSRSSFQDMLLLTKVRSKGHCSMKQKVTGSSQTWQIIFRRTWILFLLFRERQQSQGKEEVTCSKGPWVTNNPANISILR